MFFCTDVHYDDDAGVAAAAALGFLHSTDPEPAAWFTEIVRGVAPYEPGAFYLRELPCLLAVLATAEASHPVDLVVVDGHVWLREGQPGLGHHLWRALGERIPVVGVAKNPFVDGAAVPVQRSTSRRPLYVTSVGVDVEEAASFVRHMHGPYRIPSLLGRVDGLCRSALTKVRLDG